MKTVFRESASKYPASLYIFESSVVTYTTLWLAARPWRIFFRNFRKKGGKRILVCGQEGPGFLQVFSAALSEGVSVIIAADTDAKTCPVKRDLDIMTGGQDFLAPPQGYSVPAAATEISRNHLSAVILATSGTVNKKWVALSESGISNVLHSHRIIYRNAGQAVTASVLPWSHCFGLVLELLLGTVHGAHFVRMAQATDGVRAGHRFDHYKCNYLFSVPYLLKLWLDDPGFTKRIYSLKGGVIGGSPVDARLSSKLSGSCLRVGYGCSEASPGISLGKPGEFESCYLGRPLGCKVLLQNGSIGFTGDNLSPGHWDSSGNWFPHTPGVWFDTGDTGKLRDGRLFFCGRNNNMIKLPNGSWYNLDMIAIKLADCGIEGLAQLDEHSDVCICLSDQRVEAARRALGGVGRFFTFRVVKAGDLSRSQKGNLRLREGRREHHAGH